VGPRRERRRDTRIALFALFVACLSLPAPLLRAAEPQDQEARIARAVAALTRGRFDEVESILREAEARDPRVAALRGRALSARGRDAEAETALKQAAERAPQSDAALELGLLQMAGGRRDAAMATLQPIVESGPDASTAAALLRVARAARALGRFEAANSYFREAVAAAPDDPGANTAWAELFLEKHNIEDAVTSFQAALKANPEWTPAHLGLARAMVGDNPPAAMMSAARALAINPACGDARLLIAELELNRDRRDDGRKAIERALETNPRSLGAHALLGAIAALDGRQADLDAEVQRAREINPASGEVYRVAAEHLSRHYRFDEAVALARRAVEVDPADARAQAGLGMHLLRTGDEAAARQALDEAFRRDPYDLFTYNLLSLLDALREFETIEDGPIVMRLQRDEAAVMKEYALPLAREALQAFRRRYGFEPRGPILIEMFPRHDDFAVRTLGLPGMIGALGACFGRVVTLDSPRARPPGTFDWRATLWHELAHVITLQMSNARVPRWLTEGISVFEEQRARPEWGREGEADLPAALDDGAVLRIADLDTGFTNPRTIGLAYYQASLVVEHIVARFGDAGLQKLLRAYGDGLQTPAAVSRALGVTLGDLQATFDQALASRFDPVRRALRVPPNLSLDDASLDQLTAAAAAYPDSYPVQRAAGRALKNAGDRAGAVAALERAVSLVPTATGRDGARLPLADIALERGDPARAAELLEAELHHDSSNVELARRLAGLLDGASDGDRDDERVRRVNETIAGLDPFDASAHRVLGQLAVARDDGDTAVREFRAVVAVGAADRADARCDLAEAYFVARRLPEAKRETLAALEIAPLYERAQDLLLKIVERRSR
jgi:tetratricopeptide (TPR) repeat protein